MADITHLFLRRHLGSGPTAWTRHSVGGRVRHEGVGLSVLRLPGAHGGDLRGARRGP